MTSPDNKRVQVIKCGPYANESERLACARIKSQLVSRTDSGYWRLLTNYSSSSNTGYLSDEIDLVAIGPSGVWIIEIKHWPEQFLRSRPDAAAHEAEKLNAKVKRLGGKLRREFSQCGFFEGALLLTAKPNQTFFDKNQRERIRGVPVFGLKEWDSLLHVNGKAVLSPEEIERLVSYLVPRSEALLSDRLTRFDVFSDLSLLSQTGDGFCRTYRGKREPEQERVFLHLYDLSAHDGKGARKRAEREHEALQKLQKCRALPSLRDSFQEASHYPGELYFFSYIDSGAPTLNERVRDNSWDVKDRIRVSIAVLEALNELHQAADGIKEGSVLHRNLNPDTVQVDSKGRVTFLDLSVARAPAVETLSQATDGGQPKDADEFVAPEIRKMGLVAGSLKSDIYSISRCLLELFGDNDEESTKARGILENGSKAESKDRPALDELVAALRTLYEPYEAPKPEGAPDEIPDVPVQFWDDSVRAPFKGRLYRIISKLGSGGVGTAFKVVEESAEGEELSGPYVAKVISSADLGGPACVAYSKVRPHTGTSELPVVWDVCDNWEPNRFSALLKWVDGYPLDQLVGVVELHFEESGLALSDSTLIEWIMQPLRGLEVLHQAALVHGDISPRNLIANSEKLVLIDFDCAGPFEQKARAGTEPYCSARVSNREPIDGKDDLFALGATFFEVVFERRPFRTPTGIDKFGGLNWEGLERDRFPRFCEFLDRLVAGQFNDASEALAHLSIKTCVESQQLRTLVKPTPATKNIVPRINSLLQNYPGSRQGNIETRGLDSDFARETYVTTDLDEQICKAVKEASINLVILCGNAGDGKTAFLQNLRLNLGLAPSQSSERIWEEQLPNGVRIRVNLDGSAAYGERSAGELLDQFFEPFANNDFPEDLVHLIAINDGPLLQWLDDRNKDDYLSQNLSDAVLNGEAVDERIAFINLNNRSLVGGHSEGQFTAGFFEKLLDRLLGGPEEWKPCATCVARNRCQTNRAVSSLFDPNLGPRIRENLSKALLAVHQRGEVHITARELRAALTYIFFGIHNCQDLHGDPSLQTMPYYELAFNPLSPARQGLLLSELAQIDPGLSCHPTADRYLLRELATPESGGEVLVGAKAREQLRSARRRAYFEMTDAVEKRVGTRVGLQGSSQLSRFLEVANCDNDRLVEIRDDLLDGIASLENLPNDAYREPDLVPFKLVPRTPTETAFWVLKPRDSFTLEALTPMAQLGIEVLHTHMLLSYEHEARKYELRLGAELFDLLLRVKDGEQLCDSRSEAMFSNLSIFTQRIAQENDVLMRAWNPLADTSFEIQAQKNEKSPQVLSLEEVRLNV